MTVASKTGPRDCPGNLSRRAGQRQVCPRDSAPHTHFASRRRALLRGFDLARTRVETCYMHRSQGDAPASSDEIGPSSRNSRGRPPFMSGRGFSFCSLSFLQFRFLRVSVPSLLFCYLALKYQNSKISCPPIQLGSTLLNPLFSFYFSFLFTNPILSIR